MQVLPVTFMKQSEGNKKHLGNKSLDLMFFIIFFISERAQQFLSVVGVASPFFSRGRTVLFKIQKTAQW